MEMIDLGTSPPSNAYLKREQLGSPELWFPLRVLVCESCWLVQTEDFTRADELFAEDYAYFSSVSRSWLEHAQAYADQVQSRFLLDSSSLVIEVASNDGYLLQYFQKKGIPSLGIEPTASTATAARQKGLEVIQEFFGLDLGRRLRRDGIKADLVVANNVLAHVPDINDFVEGMAEVLKPGGVVTFEFPHLQKLLEQCLFDTIYHEHYSYLSLQAVQTILAAAGLSVFDVEELATHGGSLRVFAQSASSGKQKLEPRVRNILDGERKFGMTSRKTYDCLQTAAHQLKFEMLQFLLEARRTGKKVVAYGAAAKGNTFINYAGIRGDLMPLVVDRNPMKQGKFLPGSRIPIVAESALEERKPDYIWILPWNLRDEIVDQLQYVRQWNCRFVTAVPHLEVFE